MRRSERVHQPAQELLGPLVLRVAQQLRLGRRDTEVHGRRALERDCPVSQSVEPRAPAWRLVDQRPRRHRPRREPAGHHSRPAVDQGVPVRQDGPLHRGEALGSGVVEDVGAARAGIHLVARLVTQEHRRASTRHRHDPHEAPGQGAYEAAPGAPPIKSEKAYAPHRARQSDLTGSASRHLNLRPGAARAIRCSRLYRSHQARRASAPLADATRTHRKRGVCVGFWPADQISGLVRHRLTRPDTSG